MKNTICTTVVTMSVFTKCPVLSGRLAFHLPDGLAPIEVWTLFGPNGPGVVALATFERNKHDKNDNVML